MLRRLHGKALSWDIPPDRHVDLEVSWGRRPIPARNASWYSLFEMRATAGPSLPSRRACRVTSSPPGMLDSYTDPLADRVTVQGGVEVVRQSAPIRHVEVADRPGHNLGKSARSHAPALRRTCRRAHARHRCVDHARRGIRSALPRRQPPRAAGFRSAAGTQPRTCVRLYARQYLPRAS